MAGKLESTSSKDGLNFSMYKKRQNSKKDQVLRKMGKIGKQQTAILSVFAESEKA